LQVPKKRGFEVHVLNTGGFDEEELKAIGKSL
jgi:hypothetical protein